MVVLTNFCNLKNGGKNHWPNIFAFIIHKLNIKIFWGYNIRHYKLLLSKVVYIYIMQNFGDPSKKRFYLVVNPWILSRKIPLYDFSGKIYTIYSFDFFLYELIKRFRLSWRDNLLLSKILHFRYNLSYGSFFFWNVFMKYLLHYEIQMLLVFIKIRYS